MRISSFQLVEGYSLIDENNENVGLYACKHAAFANMEPTDIAMPTLILLNGAGEALCSEELPYPLLN